MEYKSPPSLLNDRRSALQVEHDARVRAEAQQRSPASREVPHQTYRLSTPNIVGRVYKAFQGKF
jgi:hypothetical protein